MVAKAMTRKGTALEKKGDMAQAIEVYNRALTEHRNPDTLKKLKVRGPHRVYSQSTVVQLDCCVQPRSRT
eukprot:4889230-Pyramimonas_sp.AAC.1